MSKEQFHKRLSLLVDDQQKRKKIIHQIQQVAKSKNYDISNKGYICNEICKYEWFVASDEPSLVDALYYLYFWVLLKGKYLLEDIDEEKAVKLKKRRNFYNSNDEQSSRSGNPSSDSLSSFTSMTSSPSTGSFGGSEVLFANSNGSSIANHHSATRFEKDILKAKHSVNDLRSQFAKIIDAESAGGASSSTSSISSVDKNRLRKTPTSSPTAKKFAVNIDPPQNPSHHSLAHKVSELNLMDSPYIKNVLKFKYEMSTYINILVENYSLSNQTLPLQDLISGSTISPPEILYLDNKPNIGIISRIPGYQHYLFIVSNPIDESCSGHLKFVHSLLKSHFETGLAWDIHSVFQTSGKLYSSIVKINRASKFLNFDKVLVNLIFEFYKDKSIRDNLIKKFNMDPQHHLKINPNLKNDYSVNSTLWKSWNELDFVCLDNNIFKTETCKDILEKRDSLNKDKSFIYKSWSAQSNEIAELVYSPKEQK